jgi:hypothetical protein
VADHWLLGDFAHEDRPDDQGAGLVALHRRVVRPSTWPLVLPVSAQRDRDGGAGRPLVPAGSQLEPGLVSEDITHRPSI